METSGRKRRVVLGDLRDAALMISGHQPFQLLINLLFLLCSEMYEHFAGVVIHRLVRQ